IGTGEPVFTAEEIREEAGYDPLEGGDPLPDTEPEDEDAARTDPTGERQ
ncbi:TPA: DUF1073 domain-containing protein, partial [Pseudomonas aeruginosa]|nr:DUF1073 domain-containing protein [Pseudomonas aeruginosa]